MKKLKLTRESSKNVQYGRQVYSRAIAKEYSDCIELLRELEMEDSSKKHFAANLLNNRFRVVCKEIKDDFSRKYNSSYDTNHLNDLIMEKSIMLNNMMVEKML